MGTRREPQLERTVRIAIHAGRQLPLSRPVWHAVRTYPPHRRCASGLWKAGWTTLCRRQLLVRSTVNLGLSAVDAASALRAGGIIACPTEAVWGLSCDPFNEATVQRLLAIKQRPVDKGLILIAASVAQLDGLADWDALPRNRRDEVLATWPGPPTWIVPAPPRVPRWARKRVVEGKRGSVRVDLGGRRSIKKKKKDT